MGMADPATRVNDHCPKPRTHPLQSPSLSSWLGLDRTGQLSHASPTPAHRIQNNTELVSGTRVTPRTGKQDSEKRCRVIRLGTRTHRRDRHPPALGLESAHRPQHIQDRLQLCARFTARAPDIAVAVGGATGGDDYVRMGSYRSSRPRRPHLCNRKPRAPTQQLSAVKPWTVCAGSEAGALV